METKTYNVMYICKTRKSRLNHQGNAKRLSQISVIFMVANSGLKTMWQCKYLKVNYVIFNRGLKLLDLLAVFKIVSFEFSVDYDNTLYLS